MSNQDNINDYISNNSSQDSNNSNDPQPQNQDVPQGTFSANNNGTGMEAFPTPETAQNPESGKTIEAYRSDELLQPQELLKPAETLTSQESQPKDLETEQNINVDDATVANEEPHNIVDLRSNHEELHDISSKDKVTQKADEEEKDFIEKVEERHAHK